MNTILGELGKNPKFCEYIKTIESKKSPIAISGLTDVGMTQMISATREFAKRPILVIRYNEIQTQKILKDFCKNRNNCRNNLYNRLSIRRQCEN